MHRASARGSAIGMSRSTTERDRATDDRPPLAAPCADRADRTDRDDRAPGRLPGVRTIARSAPHAAFIASAIRCGAVGRAYIRSRYARRFGNVSSNPYSPAQSIR